jgi:hypothetical protein
MLSSIILSLAINAAPVPTAEVVKLDIQEIGRSRGSVRIDDSPESKEVGRSHGSVRINYSSESKEVGRSRGSVRI